MGSAGSWGWGKLGVGLGRGWGLGLGRLPGLGRLVDWPWAPEAKMRRSGRSQQRDDLMIQVIHLHTPAVLSSGSGGPPLPPHPSVELWQQRAS